METSIQESDQSRGFGEAGLREVLALEQQAKAMLRDAEVETHRIVAEARRQAEELGAAMRAEANQEAEAAGRESQAQIEEQVRLIREKAEREAEAWEQVAGAHFEQALAFVLDAVTMGGAG